MEFELMKVSLLLQEMSRRFAAKEISFSIVSNRTGTARSTGWSSHVP